MIRCRTTSEEVTAALDRITFDPYLGKVDTTQHYYHNGRYVSEDEGIRGDDSRIVMDAALGFVQDRANDRKPFFAFICFHAVHYPLGIRRANIAALGCLLLLEHAERHAGSGRRDAAVDRRRRADQGAEFVVGEACSIFYWLPVSDVCEIGCPALGQFRKELLSILTFLKSSILIACDSGRMLPRGRKTFSQMRTSATSCK